MKSPLTTSVDAAPETPSQGNAMNNDSFWEWLRQQTAQTGAQAGATNEQNAAAIAQRQAFRPPPGVDPIGGAAQKAFLQQHGKLPRTANAAKHEAAMRYMAASPDEAAKKLASMKGGLAGKRKSDREREGDDAARQLDAMKPPPPMPQMQPAPPRRGAAGLLMSAAEGASGDTRGARGYEAAEQLTPPPAPAQPATPLAFKSGVSMPSWAAEDNPEMMPPRRF